MSEHRFVVAVTGGRDFDDRARVFEALDEIHAKYKITLLVHGGASGADSFAQGWAVTCAVPSRVYYPNWAEGRSAGPRRNAWMLAHSNPNLLVAFPGGRGTADCVERAFSRGVRIWRVIPKLPMKKRAPRKRIGL